MSMYVYDLILLHKNNNTINQDIKLMKDVFKIKDMGAVSDYLGVKI